MKILVLCGGDSPERDVSLESGAAVVSALLDAGHSVETQEPSDSFSSVDCDIVFPMVHGTGGEDGRLQRVLDAASLAYVGSSAAASELTFNKKATLQKLRTAGLPVPEHDLVSRQTRATFTQRMLERVELPVVVKPVRQGSSVGISIVRELTTLDAAINLALDFDDECLVERYIPGREITVPVIDGQPYPAVEIIPAVEWYDYSAKYSDDRTRYVVDPDGVADAVDVAIQACRLCGVSGISRVDLRVDESGNPWILEINTIPGMTSHSLVPKSAAFRGQSLAELCNQVVIRRMQQRAA